MHLITQPDDSLTPLVEAVRGATKRVDIVIFRFDTRALERELAAAVERGIVVRALVAHTNSGGEKRLRALEQRLLAAGVAVARTDDELVRYHGKLLLIDHRELYVLGFNYTAADLKSRSFGIVTKDRDVVQDIIGMLEADALRQSYTPRSDDLVVSPENARQRLMEFVRQAKTSLDIYDPGLSDDACLEVIARLAKNGVAVRILGKLEKKWRGEHIEARPFPGGRLHVRAMVRDGREAFVGSQSLRKLELDRRREVGLLIRDAGVAGQIARVFDQDWQLTDIVTE